MLIEYGFFKASFGSPPFYSKTRTILRNSTYVILILGTGKQTGLPIAYRRV